MGYAGISHSRSDVETGFNEKAALLPIWLAAVYGGYFGAGMSVIILAVLSQLGPSPAVYPRRASGLSLGHVTADHCVIRIRQSSYPETTGTS